MASALTLFLLHLLLVQPADTLPAEKARIYNARANELISKQPQEAAGLLEKAHALAVEAGGDSLLMDIEKNLGILGWFTGRYESALNWYVSASRKALARGDSLSFYKLQINIGQVHSQLKDYDRALSYYDQSIRYLKQRDEHKKLLANTYISYGVVKRRSKDYPAALSTFEKALKLMRETGFQEGEAQVLSNMGNVYVDLRDFRQAVSLLRVALETSEKLGSINGQVNTLLSLGEAYALQKQCRESQAVLLKGLALAEARGYRSQQSTYYQRLGRAAECLQDYKAALSWNARYHTLADSLDKEAQAKEIARIESQYTVERMARENDLLKQTNATNAKLIAWQRGAAAMLSVGLALFGVLTFYFMKARRRVQRQKEELAEKARIIQEQTQQLLDLNEGRLQQMLDNALDAVVEMDDKGNVISWSKRAEQIFGFTAADVIGRPMAETIVPARLREAHERGFQRVRTTGESHILGRMVEMPALRKDGSELPVELTVSRFEHRGRVIFNAFLRDITDRKRAEAELQQAQQQALDSIRERSELIARQNEALEDRVRQRTEEISRRNAELTEARDGLERALAELKATQSQLIQQEKLASLGQLTAGIAHEIKNPLNFVTNFAGLTATLTADLRKIIKPADAPLPPRLEGLLTDIEGNVKRIQEHGLRADRIVRTMLEHARGNAGARVPVDLNELVKEYANLSFHGMRAGARKMPCDLTFHLDESVGRIPLVPQDVSRVLVNLCTNAFDAMWERWKQASDSGYQPALVLTTVRTNGTIRLTVEDNGTGIPENLHDKVMQPFFTTKKGAEGTGLGLSITHDILRAHGGSLEIDSRPGTTRMTVVLPVA